MWKLKSSTSTWSTASVGTVIAGYNFDTVYTDIPGGTYRIRFEDGTLNGAAVVTITGEGRDADRKEIRAIEAVYQNISIPGAIIAGGNLTQAGTSVVQWGPVMAMGPITLSGSALTEGYPRKLSKQSVLPFDVNGVTPPNTDNLEWWSDYDVPELPVFDFAAMKSSAIFTNTYNCNGVWNAAIADQILCNTGCTSCNIAGLTNDSRSGNDYIWYWDQDVVINGSGTKGTTIVRGNLTLKGGDYGNVSMSMRVPFGAWREYLKIDVAGNQYPGDNGTAAVKNEYQLGSCGSTCEGGATGNDLGFNGFVYVGADITMTAGSAADIYGAVWVVGNWNSASNNIIFFNDQLNIPTLNVVLVRQSWEEIMPSATAWP
jgi:hypothetical protein